MGLKAYLTSAVLIGALLSGCSQSSDEPAETTKIEEPAKPIIIAAPSAREPLNAASDNATVETENISPEQIFGHSLPLFATGNEPFWTAEIEGGWIVFERPGLPLVEVPLPAFDVQQAVIEFSSEGLDVSLSDQACNDNLGPIQIKLTLNEDDYFGCVVSKNEQTIHAGSDYSWKDLISPSLKAIDGCLGTSDEGRFVEALYPREPGTVGMILRNAFGSYYECGADVETGEVYFVDAMAREQAEAWITGAAFARVDKSPSCSNGKPYEDLGTFSAIGCL